jgi:hypothetical protein
MTARIRNISILAVALVFVVLLVPTVAFANAGVHGNYSMAGTDSCAGCHRAHTAPSPVTWDDSNGVTHSALLLGTYTEVSEFCLTCHGNVAAGADTNVIGGVYESRLAGSAHSYGTPGDALISGPFGISAGLDASGNAFNIDFGGRRVTSTHDYFGATWKVWGAGVYSRTATASWDASLPPYVGAGSQQVTLDCSSCHDVHGSSNYRLLKDKVFGGVTVGGYGAGDVPSPYVVSAEVGFPVGGFRLHEDAIAGGYAPNYTEARYAKAPTSTVHPDHADPDRGMSGWCVGCHTFYMGNAETSATVYNAGDGFGTITRHRHPVNTRLGGFAGPRPVVQDATNPLPLAHDSSEGFAVGSTPVNSGDDWVDCLTCHYAHGSTSVMTGFANVQDSRNPAPDTGGGGVAPTYDSALLRGNNRYVCQACHNK